MYMCVFFFFSDDYTIKVYILFKERKKKKKEEERRTEGVKEVRLWKKKKEVKACERVLIMFGHIK